ncbi:MAG: T9SS type A sorting domain-containing protein, partial [Candidatus Krumholzibacteria bacterium]|nr:T9SS type A sorting domain-containing protein [Candidatus Krumholzibacteria bacterium]
KVSVEIFDVAGRRVRLLEHDNSRREGTHTLFWNGMNDSGSRVASGVYFYRIDAGFDVRTQRLVVLK